MPVVQVQPVPRPQRCPPMGSHSRRKGAQGEREACRVLERITGISWVRSLVQSRFGGAEAPDVVPAHRHPLEGLHVEVKRGARPNPWAALEQATRDAGEARTPMVLMRRDREGWVVVMRADDLPELVRMWGAHGGG